MHVTECLGKAPFGKMCSCHHGKSRRDPHFVLLKDYDSCDAGCLQTRSLAFVSWTPKLDSVSWQAVLMMTDPSRGFAVSIVMWFGQFKLL